MPYVRTSVTIDWPLRDSTRAQIRVIRRILRKIRLPAGQAGKRHPNRPELLCADWAGYTATKSSILNRNGAGQKRLLGQ